MMYFHQGYYSTRVWFLGGHIVYCTGENEHV